jgi:uncharacterized glyoxalase superfamily protein PhnB
MSKNLIASIPVFHVSDAQSAEAFYCQSLGFLKEWEYKPNSPSPNPAYIGLQREDIWLHISSFPGDGVAGGVVLIVVHDVDRLFAEFSAKSVAIDLAPYDQSWGTREMYVRDLDNNSLRFQQTAK